MRDCSECGLDFSPTDRGRFCSYDCERAFKLKFDMAAFVAQVVVPGDCPGYFEMSNKEQRVAMRAWKASRQ